MKVKVIVANVCRLGKAQNVSKVIEWNTHCGMTAKLVWKTIRVLDYPYPRPNVINKL